MSSELVVAIVSALAAVVAAIVAALISANSTRKTGIIDAQSQQLRELESRNATRKYDTYQPILELYSVLLSPHGEKMKKGFADIDLEKTFDEFAQWVAIYGSDEVVRTYHDFSETMASVHELGKDMWLFLPLIYRLYGEFVLAVRRDLGYPNTKLDVRYVLANGSFQFYGSHLWPTSCLPLGRLYEKYRKEYNWHPTWEDPLLLNKNATSGEALGSHPKTLVPGEQNL